MTAGLGLVGIAFGQASAPPSPNKLEIGLVKYKGGGDWYSAGRALQNLITYIRSNTNIDLAPEPVAVEPGSVALRHGVHLTFQCKAIRRWETTTWPRR